VDMGAAEGFSPADIAEPRSVTLRDPPINPRRFDEIASLARIRRERSVSFTGNVWQGQDGRIGGAFTYGWVSSRTR